MRFGLFHTPYTRPDRTAKQTFEWAVAQGVAAEQAGLDEYWVGQHFTIGWEGIPNPEMVLSVLARETEHITLAPGAHTLPYLNPAALATQAAWLSDILEGRYILGVAAGSSPYDAALHGIDDMRNNLAMIDEGLDIIQKVWDGEPYRHEGAHWTSTIPAEVDGNPLRDLRPHHGPIPIAIGAASPGSSSIRLAGRRGLIPLSFSSSPTLVANHWQTYLDGAEEAGRGGEHDRDSHHVAIDVFVADSDAEAVRRVKEGGQIERTWRGHFIPAAQVRARQLGTKPIWSEDLTIDEIIRDYMIVGGPDTVAERFEQQLESSGGWGTSLILSHDFIDDPQPWNQSMELLVREVAPRIRSTAALSAPVTI